MKRTYTYQSAAGLSKWIAGVVWLFVLVQASIIAFAAFALFTFISILQPVKAVLENNQQLTELNVDFMAIVTSSIILFAPILMRNHSTFPICSFRPHGHWVDFLCHF